MIKPHFPGRFVTLEGGEGAGKSSLLRFLEEHFGKKGIEVVATREPGGSFLGEEVRKLLLTVREEEQIASQAELLLFLAARAQHIHQLIRPFLEKGKLVICDRFNDSTVAYQGVARGFGFDYVKSLCALVCKEVTPELTLFLDVDPKIGLLRARKTAKEQAGAGELDRIEQEGLSFHQNIQAAFRQMALEEPSRLIRIDAGRTQMEVFSESARVIEDYLKQSGFSPA